MTETDSKAFLYGWLGKKKVTPEYNMRPTGPKHRQRFLCELRVPVKRFYDFLNSIHYRPLIMSQKGTTR